MAESEKKRINFELVSPEARLLAAPVRMAVIPAVEGEMGVGAGHASFVVSLKAGVVRLFENDMADTPRRIFIAGGFADVSNENCTVLAEEAINVEAINTEAVNAEIAALQEEIRDSREPAQRTKLNTRLALAQERLRAATV